VPKKAKNSIHRHWMAQVEDKNLGASIRDWYRKKLVGAGYKEYANDEQSTDGEGEKEG
jgi:hypothetical protein